MYGVPLRLVVTAVMVVIGIAVLGWLALDNRATGRLEAQQEQQERDRDAIQNGRAGRSDALREFDARELHDDVGDE